jgi:hypothetical protein
MTWKCRRFPLRRRLCRPEALKEIIDARVWGGILWGAKTLFTSRVSPICRQKRVWQPTRARAPLRLRHRTDDAEKLRG